MPQTQVSTNEVLNRIRLVGGNKLEHLSRKAGVFASIFRVNSAGVAISEVDSMGAKIIKPIGDAKNPKFAGSLIETWEDTAGAEGGDQVQVPVSGHLYKGPVIGNGNGVGTGEAPPIYARTMYLSEGMKVLSQLTGINKQRVAQFIVNALNNPNNALTDWWGHYQDGNIMLTELTGFSLELNNYGKYWNIAGIGTEGIESSITPFSHPNMLIPGHGKVEYTNGRPGSQGYENTAIGYLDSCIGNNAKKPSVELLGLIQGECNKMNIDQLQTDLGPITCHFMDQSTLDIIQSSVTYNDWMKWQWMGSKSDPNSQIMMRSQAVIKGNALFVVPGMFGVQSNQNGIVTNAQSTLTMPQYGPTNFWISEDGTSYNLDTNDVKFIMTLGQHSIHQLFGRNRMFFEPGQKKNFRGEPDEVAMRWTQTLCRDDVFDPRGETQTANDFKINSSSAVTAVYSPANGW